MCTSPRVSVIITAFNLAHYLPAAIDSALAQESPGGPVQVIVVDDGSTDDTPQVLARYADTVEIIRQANGGLVAAVDRGLQAVRGEYVALLDADDEWPRDRLRRHVEILDGNPLVGLVHGDMRVIDAGGTTIHQSFFAWKQETPVNGRILGELVKDNFVSGGASTFRGSLLPAIHPISPDAIYPDWWIATNIAAVAEIMYDPGISNLYRLHDANMGLGADRQQVLDIERRELPFRRWMMSNLIDDDTFSVRHVANALLRWRQALVHSGMSRPGSVRHLIQGDPEAAASAAAAAEHLVGPGRCKALMRALSRDPFDGAVWTDLEVALLQVGDVPAAVPPPLIALQTRPQLALGWLDELVARPELLRCFAGDPTADDWTLAVLAPVAADLSALIALVDDDPVLSDERCDFQVLSEPQSTPGRRLLAARSTALLSAQPQAAPFSTLTLHAAVKHARRAGLTMLAAGPRPAVAA
jgi:glycosyltransferase involved in cell wall biosynthesis